MTLPSQLAFRPVPATERPMLAALKAEVAASDVLERLTALYPKAIDLSLDRVRRLMADLGDPQERLPPTIHVAGTNGKGSTVAYLRAMLEAAGRRVHVYTSPHLVRFNERIRLAGRLIDDAELGAILAEVERVNAGRPITFFEVTTAAAFLAFARHPADAVILETGMGGRLDATNLLHRPAANAITPISLDHTDYLGSTIAAIAGEKAGILRAGVAAAIGPQPEEAARVLAGVAGALGTPLHRAGAEWRIERRRGGFRFTGRRVLDLPPPALLGAHQFQNAGLAIAALELVPMLDPGEAAIRRGLAAVEWPGRLQRLTRGKLAAMLPPGVRLFLDGGHNESAGEALALWAREEGVPLDLVFGMRANKAVDRFFAHLGPHLRRVRAVPIPGDPLSLDAATVIEAARAGGVADIGAAESVESAVSELAAAAESPNCLLICGSLYLAGHVLAANG
jgi:dihydrofolate synthase/folylpolyglutamate synthase